MRTLQLTLHAKDIKLAVKADTYITGQIDKSSDMVKNAALAYNEQAGDESYHEVKLYRTMRGAVSKFEAAMAEYVESSSSSSVADTLTSGTADEFTITFTVGARYNGAYSNTIASLAQEFIINMMLYAWWQSIKPALAKDYLEFSMENLSYIRRCLSKTAPDTNTSSYSDVTGSTSPITSGDGGNSSRTLLSTLNPTGASVWGLSDDGHLVGDDIFLLEAELLDGRIDSDNEQLELEYSGGISTGFRYAKVYDDLETLASPVSASLSEIAVAVLQNTTTYPKVLVWPDGASAAGKTLSVYKKSK